MVIRIHSDSLRFIQTHSASFKFPRAISVCLNHIHSVSFWFAFLPKLTQSHTDALNRIRCRHESLSLIQIQSDQLMLSRTGLPRFTHSRSDSLRLTQAFPDVFNLIFVHTGFRSVQIL